MSGACDEQRLADIAANVRRGKSAQEISPLALEAVRRIDALFDVERATAGMSADRRLAARQEHAKPLVEELEAWMRRERAAMSKHAPVAKAMDYMLTRWDGFTRFLQDGRVCLTNNAAERALRGIALGRKAWLFCGSDRGGQRAAILYGLITTCLCRVRHKADYAERRTMPSIVALSRWAGAVAFQRSA